jgi:hypothetical protein
LPNFATFGQNIRPEGKVVWAESALLALAHVPLKPAFHWKISEQFQSATWEQTH